MAITNLQIINDYKALHNIPLEKPLLTYAAWAEKGYQVRKGEKARHKVPMWKRTMKKDDNGEMVDTGGYINRTMSLFEFDQVEKI